MLRVPLRLILLRPEDIKNRALGVDVESENLVGKRSHFVCTGVSDFGAKIQGYRPGRAIRGMGRQGVYVLYTR